jgi:hypothetical protein
MTTERRFEILDEETVIGTTSFESGDPPMGVVHGAFEANSAYRLEHADRNGNLTARIGGQLIPSAGGVGIDDLFDEIGEREVTIFGIDHKLYAELFPEHVAAYEALYPTT